MNRRAKIRMSIGLMLAISMIIPAYRVYAAGEVSYQSAAKQSSFDYLGAAGGYVEGHAIEWCGKAAEAYGNYFVNGGKKLIENNSYAKGSAEYLKYNEIAGEYVKFGEKFKKVAEGVDYIGMAHGMYEDGKYLLSGKSAYNSETLETLYDGLIGLDNTLGIYEKTFPQFEAQIKGMKKVTGWAKDVTGNGEFQKLVNENEWINENLKDADSEVRAFQGSLVYWYNRFSGMSDEDARNAMNDYMEQRTYKREGQLNKNEMPEWAKRKYAEAERERRIQMNNKAKENIRQSKNANAYKPNIYLYPEAEMDLVVSFSVPGLITTVIPDYKDCWEVTASPSGKITDKTDEQEYDYLFYESDTQRFLYQYEEGFIIKADERFDAFTKILTAYGLNAVEIEDFTDYWCEKLEEGVDYYMYPQLNAVVDKAMPINFSTTPDTLLRIWFVFESCDGSGNTGNTNHEIVVPTVVPVARKGFTVIEWGGVLWE